jgi:hypothetical protein
MKKIPLLLILVCAFANGQDFKELYVEKQKGTWEYYESESFAKTIDPKMDSLYLKTKGKSYKEILIEQQKNSVKERSEKLSELIQFFKLKISELDSLTIIEQKSLNNSLPTDFTKRGAIIAKDSIYGFSYNLDDERNKILKIDYFKNSNSEIISQAKQIIGNLIISGKTNYLDTIAKVESDMFSGPLKELSPETEFEIIIYNKKKNEKLRNIFLHETFIQIMNQK